MKHKTLTVILGSICTILLGTTAGLEQTAHADHESIHIKTGKGNFVYDSDAVIDALCNKMNTVEGIVTQKVIDGLQHIDGVEYIQKDGIEKIQRYTWRIDNTLAHVEIPTIGNTVIIADNVYIEYEKRGKLERINGIFMYEQTEQCKDNKINYSSIVLYDSDKKNIDKWIEAGGEISTQQENLECLCKYMNANTLKHEYTYFITDMAKNSYQQYTVAEGVVAGLNQWSNINDIIFTQTNSILEANIVIQQQIGDGTQFGNAHVGCLFEHEQCTIQIFTDLNIHGQQTLVSKQSIEFTIAHEFGHLIGLPHHTDASHLMNTQHANNVRTYYETQNINVPQLTELTYEQRLLGYEWDEDEQRPLGYEWDEALTPIHENIETETIDHTNITKIIEHETTTKFIELIQTIISNEQNISTNFWLELIQELSKKVWENHHINYIWNFNYAP